jgi:hypothetical protein
VQNHAHFPRNTNFAPKNSGFFVERNSNRRETSLAKGLAKQIRQIDKKQNSKNPERHTILHHDNKIQPRIIQHTLLLTPDF